MSVKKWSKRRIIQAICIACYVIVPVFFGIFYLLMTMSYEDLLHRSWHLQDSTCDILVYIYHYLPRLGEFYQHLTMRFMDAQTTIGVGVIFRLIDAAMCTALIYLLTIFVLKRRPRLACKDALVYLGLFIFLMFFETSEVFMYRFSYVHNYILAMLATVGFLLPYRLNLQTTNPLAIIGMILLGFFFGISTEVAPIAVMILIVATIIYKVATRQVKGKQFINRYSLQISGVIGVFLGLVFFYIGAGIEGRASGNYGIAYDYVHLTELFTAPLRTIAVIVDHFWYNARYLAFALVLLLLITFLEYIRYKRAKSNQLYLGICITAFCILFLGASSLIKLHDDIYPRFLFPAYVAIFAGLFSFLNEQLSRTDVELQSFTKLGCIVLLTIGILMTIDMTYATARYHSQVAPGVNGEIIIQDDGSVVIPDGIEPYMSSSPIFHFRQLTPFNWDSSNTYMKYDN